MSDPSKSFSSLIYRQQKMLRQYLSSRQSNEKCSFWFVISQNETFVEFQVGDSQAFKCDVLLEDLAYSEVHGHRVRKQVWWISYLVFDSHYIIGRSETATPSFFLVKIIGLHRLGIKKLLVPTTTKHKPKSNLRQRNLCSIGNFLWIGFAKIYHNNSKEILLKSGLPKV